MQVADKPCLTPPRKLTTVMFPITKHVDVRALSLSLATRCAEMNKTLLLASPYFPESILFFNGIFSLLWCGQTCVHSGVCTEVQTNKLVSAGVRVS